MFGIETVLVGESPDVFLFLIWNKPTDTRKYLISVFDIGGTGKSVKTTLAEWGQRRKAIYYPTEQAAREAWAEMKKYYGFKQEIGKVDAGE